MPPRNYILTKKKWNKFLVNLDFWILNFDILYKKTEELKYKLRISNSCRKTGTSKKKKKKKSFRWNTWNTNVTKMLSRGKWWIKTDMPCRWSNNVKIKL